MSQGILLGPDGRPYTKAEVEAETARRYAEGVTIPLYDGPHPHLDEEGDEANWKRVDSEWKRQVMEPFVRVDDEHAAQNEFATAIQNTPGFNDGWVKRNPISELSRPHTAFNILTQSMKYAEDHYIVNRAVKVKKNFALRDMQVLSSSSIASDFIASEFRRLKIRQLLSHVFRYHEITGRVVAYWGYERPVEGVCLLDPRYVVVRRMLNKEAVYLKPHPLWVSALRNANSEQYKFVQKNLPSKWLKYIKANMEIPLDKGTYALIENDLSLFDTRGFGDRVIGGVPLSACFTALQISSMLMAGDFSTAWLMKNQYTLISIGDPKLDDYVPPDSIELRKLANTFQRPEYSVVAYVDPTVNIRFFSPGADAMSSERYKHSTEAIEYVMGVPGVFTNGEGNFATGAMSIKPFREDIVNMRTNVIEQFLWPLIEVLRASAVNKRVGPRNASIDVSFDENCLKDDNQLYKELTGKWDRGAISNRALLEGRHGDFDMELQRKTEEKPHADVLQPLFDVAHGTDETVGRPSDGGLPTHEGTTGTAQPRPSTS
jgi:hypothetical protein